MPEPLLSLEGVGHAYPAPGGGGVVPVLAGVDLALMPGMALGLVGPSGAGKSTLARLCLGLERPGQGRVLFHGRDLASFGRRDWRDFRRRVQMVWQEPGLYLNPFYRVGELVAEPLAVFGMGDAAGRRTRVEELLKTVGLDPALAGRRTHQLSGGQCQRVALARALASGPELLICDEAFNGLDTISQAELTRLLMAQVDARGLALLFISHDLPLVRRICPKIISLPGRDSPGAGWPTGLN
ncbi:MAG: dipeptide/oligopeptide/nickel ABC transporter ATP-binding protein [Pseudomonadota bacterium]